MVAFYGTEPPSDSDLAIYLVISDKNYDYTFFPKVCREYKKVLLVVDIPESPFRNRETLNKYFNFVDWSKIDTIFLNLYKTEQAANLVEEYLRRNLSVNGAVICISKNEYEVKRDK